MKRKNWFVAAIIFIAVMVLAAVLYPALSERYSANGISGNTEDTATAQAEDFTVYDSEMNEVRLSDYFGKPIVINFWASWCSPCKSELPAFDNAYEKYQEDVVFLIVNLTDGQRETVESVRTFLSENDYEFPVYYDMEYDASGAYGVRSIPETVFINADGTLYDTRIGAMNEIVLESYIKNMLEEK